MKKKYFCSGFSLIETLVALVIITITISAGLMLTLSSIHEITKNKNQITAIYVSQECLELIRNNRDTAWKQNFSPFCAFPDKNAEYSIEISNKKINPSDCVSGWGMIIKKNPKNFQILQNDEGFNHTYGAPTIFQRKITLSSDKKNNVEPQKIIFTCKVSWPEQKETKQIQISEVLTNWRKK